MEFAVLAIVFATPWFRCAPAPTGHGIVAPVPTFDFHSSFTLDK